MTKTQTFIFCFGIIILIASQQSEQGGVNKPNQTTTLAKTTTAYNGADLLTGKGLKAEWIRADGALDYDQNGVADCFDLINIDLAMSTGIEPPRFNNKGKRDKWQNLLGQASYIIVDHKTLMVDQPSYDFVDLSKNPQIELRDRLVRGVTPETPKGHVAIVYQIGKDSVTVVEQDTYTNKKPWLKTYPLNHFGFALRLK
jgi:hypothetical protein